MRPLVGSPPPRIPADPRKHNARNNKKTTCYRGRVCGAVDAARLLSRLRSGLVARLASSKQKLPTCG